MGFILGMTSSPTVHIVNLMYYLIQYPKITKKIREEQKQLFSKRSPGDSNISFDDIDSLPYMRYCMNETLRISPPAYTTAFFAFSQPVKIG